MCPRPRTTRTRARCMSSFKKIADFFRLEFQRDSIDGHGMDYIASVHFDDDDSRTPGYNNAFWNGRQWAFGDGDYEVFNGFSNLLEVTANEVTHALTQYTAELEYEYQSGALNESISDAFASMIKQYYAPGGKQKAKDADWLIGEGIFLVPGVVGKDRQVGSMNDYQFFPNTGYGDYGGVHINSGIPNRAFYLAATTLGDYSWEGAGKVWHASLTDPELQDVIRKRAFQEFAHITCKHAQTMGGQPWLDGVKKAWTIVGVL
ncbi:Translation initiation factor 3 subunit b [Mortierella alpina]|uniref:Translation initiation factor 3 subunit b n=1 Tax=Mortierella alpina TaxID=64518 RepID=A0A9P6IRK4_MORAP|nr:Translation initiation factor 3 subunit b [Mortierella alpina]